MLKLAPDAYCIVGKVKEAQLTRTTDGGGENRGKRRKKREVLVE